MINSPNISRSAFEHFSKLLARNAALTPKGMQQARFYRGQRGASLVEYALLVSLIAVVSIGSVRTVGIKVSCRMAYVTEAIRRGNLPAPLSGGPCGTVPAGSP